MKITKVRITKTESDNSRCKGFASFVIEDCFAVHDVRIIEGDKGLFVAMPSKRVNEEYKDIAHPLNTETRQLIQDKILAEYNSAN